MAPSAAPLQIETLPPSAAHAAPRGSEADTLDHVKGLVRSLKPIEALDSEQDVLLALDESLLVQDKVDDELDRLLSEAAAAATTRAAILASVAQRSAAIEADVVDLTDMLATASRSSEKVSFRVRQLDVVYTRGTEAAKRIEDVLALRECAEGIRASMEVNDLAGACHNVARFLTLGDATRDESETDLGGSVASVHQINDSIKTLVVAVRAKANELATTEVGISEVAGICRLFVPLSLAEEGLDRFCTFVCESIEKENDANVEALLHPDSAYDADEEAHVACLTRLFETIAAYIDESEKAIAGEFGPLALLTLARRVQTQCDAQAESILHSYASKKQLHSVGDALRGGSADARDLDPLLNEIAVISQRTAAYFSFFLQRVSPRSDRTPSTPVTSPTTPGRTRTPRIQPDSSLRSPKPVTEPDAQSVFSTELAGSGLQIAVEALSARYVELEAYFMRENVMKAIRIDEAVTPGGGSKTSTAVDDVFFVLQKTARRAVSYASVDTLCAVINHINICLSSDLLQFVNRRLRETDRISGYQSAADVLRLGTAPVSMLTDLASKAGADLGKVDDGDSSTYGFPVALNNSQVSSEFAIRLRGEIERTVAEVFANSRERARVGPVLAQISESSRSLAAAGEEGLDKLANAFAENLRRSMDCIMDVSYDVKESSYDSEDTSDEFLRTLLSEVETKCLAGLEEKLTESNWDGTVRRLSEWSAKRIESAILPVGGMADGGKSFTYLGAIRLDRDVRALSAFFASKARRGTVRDVFARLSQISMLLNLELPQEVYDIWGANAGGMTWRLTPNEVRKTLDLRVEFSGETIKDLKL